MKTFADGKVLGRPELAVKPKMKADMKVPKVRTAPLVGPQGSQANWKPPPFR